MALHTTRWTSDICGCVIDFEWDDAQGESSRTHNQKEVCVCCLSHASVPPSALFNTVLAENQGKNRALGIIQQRVPGLKPEGIAWSFDAGRRLRVTVSGVPLPAPQRAAVQAALDAELGPGRATIL